jgi:hypothetical protein
MKITPTQAEEIVATLFQEIPGFGETALTFGSGSFAGDGDMVNDQHTPVSVKKTTTDRITVKASSEIRMAEKAGREWLFVGVFTDVLDSDDAIAVIYMMTMDGADEEGKQTYSLPYPPPNTIEEVAGGAKIQGGLIGVYLIHSMTEFEPLGEGTDWP